MLVDCLGLLSLPSRSTVSIPLCANLDNPAASTTMHLSVRAVRVC